MIIFSLMSVFMIFCSVNITYEVERQADGWCRIEEHAMARIPRLFVPIFSHNAIHAHEEILNKVKQIAESNEIITP